MAAFKTGFPTGLENMVGALQNLVGLDSIHYGAWGNLK